MQIQPQISPNWRGQRGLRLPGPPPGAASCPPAAPSPSRFQSTPPPRRDVRRDSKETLVRPRRCPCSPVPSPPFPSASRLPGGRPPPPGPPVRAPAARSVLCSRGGRPRPVSWLLSLLPPSRPLPRGGPARGTGSRLPPPAVREDSTPLSGVRSPAPAPSATHSSPDGCGRLPCLGLPSGRLSWGPHQPPVLFHRSSGRPGRFVRRTRQDVSTSARSEAVAWSPGSPLRPRCLSCLSLPRRACLAPPALAADAWCWPQGPSRLPRVSPSVRV